MVEQSLGYRATSEDLANENSVKADLERAWNCTLHHLPHLYHVDFFAERDNDLVAWVEVKQRTCRSTDYDTVFLNQSKKWNHLHALSGSAPAFFVVRWADGVTRYLDISRVRLAWLSYGGENDRWGEGQHDHEAVFEVPIREMKVL